MKIEFIEGNSATRNSGVSLNEGEAFVFVDGKQVKQELIDLFDVSGAYIGERPTGMTGKLIVNLYKISVELIDEFNQHVPGLKFTDLDNPDSFIELALIPSTVHEWNGKTREDWYISERLNDNMYTRPSGIYKKSMQASNKKWGESEIDRDQAN